MAVEPATGRLARRLPRQRAAAAASRIKDIADFEGVRDNMLVGYGLVVGLNGTGDTLSNSAFTQQSLVGDAGAAGRQHPRRTTSEHQERRRGDGHRHSAAPSRARAARIDVSVDALGDAKILLGGTLLVTPLLGADGEAYAVAQGPDASAGFQAQGAAETVTRGVPTAARIASGAIVEREVEFQLNDLQQVRLALRNPDFTTAQRDRRRRSTFGGRGHRAGRSIRRP